MNSELLDELKELRLKNRAEYLRKLSEYKLKEPAVYREILETFTKKPAIDPPARTEPVQKGYPLDLEHQDMPAEKTKIKRQFNWTVILAVFGLFAVIVVLILIFFIF